MRYVVETTARRGGWAVDKRYFTDKDKARDYFTDAIVLYSNCDVRLYAEVASIAKTIQ